MYEVLSSNPHHMRVLFGNLLLAQVWARYLHEKDYTVIIVPVHSTEPRDES